MIPDVEANKDDHLYITSLPMCFVHALAYNYNSYYIFTC